MDTFDLELGFFNKLSELIYAEFYTAQPAEDIDPSENNTIVSGSIRRGKVVKAKRYWAGTSDGIYTRVEGLYQIDLRVPLERDYALEYLKKASDAHLNHFFPTNGRGLVVTSGSTEAKINRPPEQTYLGKFGSYLREMIDIDFYVEINPT